MRQAEMTRSRRQKRAWRVRNTIRNTTSRPRLSVFRSNKHISAQIIDDAAGHSLAAASTCEKGVIDGGNGGNCAAAAKVGALLAERARAKGITAVVFDRGSYRYHGRVAALANAARAGGLEF
jgi:large subunit ribosomal protein L18